MSLLLLFNQSHVKESIADEFLAFILSEGRYKIVRLFRDGQYTFYDDFNHRHNILYVASSETKALEIAVEELEDIVNNPKAKEEDLQKFFERNPDFILNDDYKKAHSKITLTFEDGKSLIPDFVLEPYEQYALSDLLELKKPSTQVFILKKARSRFSAAVMEACAQLREYSAYFDEEDKRNKIKKKYGVFLYKPRLFLIIGRRGTISPIQVRHIESTMLGMSVKTYDDVIQRVREKVKKMRGGI